MTPEWYEIYYVGGSRAFLSGHDADGRNVEFELSESQWEKLEALNIKIHQMQNNLYRELVRDNG